MSFWFTIREGFKGFRRARLSTSLTIISIFFSHLMIGLFLLATVNFSRWVDTFKNRVELEVFLEPGADDNDAQVLARQVRAMPEVEQVRYISKKQAAERFEKEFGRSVYDVLQSNPLPTSLIVHLKPAYRNALSIDRLVRQLNKMEDVDEVVYPQRVIALIDRYLNVVYIGGVTVLLLLLIITFVLIYNTIRLTIYARRDIIEVMKLVGATKRFIKRPFLIEGLLQGAIGSVLAIGAVWGVSLLIRDHLYSGLLPVGTPIWSLLVSGLLIGYISARFSVAKHLKEI
ncbi:MAG: ABC transporter permease [Calditrichaeota bacterium]|nr:MAG: ABC transporter permease [Calditrichota bacterium]